MRCKNCKQTFEQYQFNNKFCKILDCQTAKALYLLDKKKKADKKKWNIEKRQMSISAYSNRHKKKLQDNVNKLARQIDNKFKYDCICCHLKLDKRTAGAHYHSVGNNETIRFNLHNIHAATYSCNNFKDTHHKDYAEGLQKRYGTAYYNYVEYTLKQHPLIKLTEQEIYDKKTLTSKLIRTFDTFNFSTPEQAREQLNKIIAIYDPKE